MKIRQSFPLALFTGLALACGEDGETPPGGAAVDVEIKSGAPREGTVSSMSTLEARAAIEAIGADKNARVLVAAGAHTYEATTSSLEPRALYAGPGDPESTGRVYRVAPKMEGGAWLAAEAGLFIFDTLYVVKSPLVVGSGAIRGAAHVEIGPLAGLWIAGDPGLFRHQEPRLDRYSVPVLSASAIDEIAVQADGEAALVLAGGELALLYADEEKIMSDKPPLEAGTIHAIAAGAAQLFAGAERGLLRYDRSRTPAWTRFTLAAEGSDAEEVLAVAADVPSNRVFARTKTKLIELDGDTLGHFPAATLESTTPALLTVDVLGDVWMARGTTLERATLGDIDARVSFAEDVLPWVTANCSRCHQNQTQNFEDYAVFKERAEVALTRVRSGDMPRCDGGLPCSEARLEQSEYLVLENWIRDGKPE